ncbi:MAG TPA: pyridoxamine 5'-phosphate oxidase family protein [Kineosporiaceae bacterium]|nr:pyridoxamine 5'-phosphate oxidase family protein [Kineosporiaceae bacterium]
MTFASTSTTRITRLPERQRFDRAALDDVLDSALVAHLAVVRPDGTPVVLPLLHARDGDRLLLHGSTGGGLLRAAAGGAPVAVAVTVVDGLVVASSMFNSSANYRSAVIFGRCRPVPAEAKPDALRTLSERLLPGRWDEVRPPTSKELAATLVLELPLDRASVKVRSGPPAEHEDDDDLETAGAQWSGVVPLAVVPGDPLPAPGVPAGMPLPPSVQGLLQEPSGRSGREGARSGSPGSRPGPRPPA